ncbi:MAG: glycoside hydrolase family 5 protein [Oscillospiraceae bacterium]|nr:glycoside hydrolase family 5 protein [Oscillospiraceae bacterium]
MKTKTIAIICTVAIIASAGLTACNTGSKLVGFTDIVPATTPFDETDPVAGGFNLTSEELVRGIGIGWNLGNTLDAYYSDNPTQPFHWVDHDNMTEVETAWIEGPEFATTPELFARIRAAGFNAVRIPTTWFKMAGEAPDYTIRTDWMRHVRGIVDMAVAQDMYIILNTHHDEYVMRISNETEVEAAEEAVVALWTQIAKEFESYDEKLIFEGLNEPRRRTNVWTTQGRWDWSGNATTQEAVNRLNQAFVNAVRATGGNNEKRHLMLTTYAAQTGASQLNAFTLPEDPIAENGTSKFILSVHLYSPFEWAHEGKSSYNRSAKLQSELTQIANRASALGIPVIMGEFGSIDENIHRQRVKHAYDYVKIATNLRSRGNNPVVMACFWWDNASHFQIIDRTKPIDDYGLEIITAMSRARRGLDQK